MESQGVGIHILKSAGTALELGCPIRGILWSVMPSTLASPFNIAPNHVMRLKSDDSNKLVRHVCNE